MATWTLMGFTTRQSLGVCIAPNGTFYTNSTSAGGGGRVSGVHKGLNYTDPVFQTAMASPIGMCNGNGNDVYANNYNGAGIYKSIDGAGFISIASGGCYPGYSIAYNPTTDTLYQTGQLGHVGPTDCFSRTPSDSGSWTNITNINHNAMTALCVNNAIDGSVYIGIDGAWGTGAVGIYKQTAGVGSFVRTTFLGSSSPMAASPNGNVYVYYKPNLKLYKQTAGVGDFNEVTGITNPSAPGAQVSAMAFDSYGFLYIVSQAVQDVYKIELPAETVITPPVITSVTPGSLKNTITLTHS